MEGKREISNKDDGGRGKSKGKDEITVEMSEMCLRALRILCASSLSSQFVCSKRKCWTLATNALVIATIDLVDLQRSGGAIHCNSECHSAIDNVSNRPVTFLTYGTEPRRTSRWLYKVPIRAQLQHNPPGSAHEDPPAKVK